LGLELAYHKMVEFKKQKKSPGIIYKNGEIIEISAETIIIRKS